MLNKNDIIEAEISGYTSEGNGVARYKGYPVFVPGTVKGEKVKIKILKPLKKYAFGKALEIITPSEGRISPVCPISQKCGGCTIMHMSYDKQLSLKRDKVCDAMRKIGGFSDITVHDTFPSPHTLGYRNKISVPTGYVNGKYSWGYYSPHSHNVISCENCFLHDEINNEILNSVIRIFEEKNIPLYDEASHSGILRHIYIRAIRSGEIMVSIVANCSTLPFEAEITEKIKSVSPRIVSVILNINREKTNVILGRKSRVLFGRDYLLDEMCGVKFKIHHDSFYQINTATAENLYRKAVSLLGDLKGKTVIDLYCGIGTISLCLAKEAEKVYGIEYVQAAVYDAEENAKLNNICNAKFYAGDAAKVINSLYSEGVQADCVVLDPPRKGCDRVVLETIAKINPEKIVYVSCDCATLARDMKILSESGYRANEVFPFDMFPQTGHVETCVLLSKLKSSKSVSIELDLDDLEITAAEAKATYGEIKEYILDKYGLKVSSLNIAQVKQECGIIERENFNKPSGKYRQPKCPEHKFNAIKETLEHFKMI